MMPWCSHWNNGRCVWPDKLASCEHIIQLRRLWYSYIYSDSSSFIITNHCWNYCHPLALEHQLRRAALATALDKSAYITKLTCKPEDYGRVVLNDKRIPGKSTNPPRPPYMTHTMTRGCKKGCNKNCSSKIRKIPCYVVDCQRYLSKGSCVQHLETLMTWAWGDRAWWVTARCSGHV